MTAVARPARRRGVELAVGEGKHVPPVGGHEPQLIPLAAEVGAVYDAGAVGRPVGARLPRRLLVADLAQRRAGSGVHAPESTRPVDMPAVRYDQQLAPVRGPRGRDVVVPPGVVVARQPGVVVFREPGDLAAGGYHREDVPTPVVNRGHERNPRPVGGCVRVLCLQPADRKSTRLNSSHLVISYAVFFL